MADRQDGNIIGTEWSATGRFLRWDINLRWTKVMESLLGPVDASMVLEMSLMVSCAMVRYVVGIKVVG
jgi:hypothetical protein